MVAPSSPSKVKLYTSALGSSPRPWFLKAKDLYEVVKRSLSDVSLGNETIGEKAIAAIDFTTLAISSNILHVSSDDAESMIAFLDQAVTTKLGDLDRGIDSGRAKLAASLLALEDSIEIHSEKMENIAKTAREKTLQVVTNLEGSIEYVDDYIRQLIEQGLERGKESFPRCSSAARNILQPSNGSNGNSVDLWTAMYEEDYEYDAYTHIVHKPWEVSVQELIEVLRGAVNDARSNCVVTVKRGVDVVCGLTRSIREGFISRFSLKQMIADEDVGFIPSMRTQLSRLVEQVREIIDEMGVSIGEGRNFEELFTYRVMLMESLIQFQDQLRHISTHNMCRARRLRDSAETTLRRSVSSTEVYIISLVDRFREAYPEATAQFMKGVRRSTLMVERAKTVPTTLKQQLIGQVSDLAVAGALVVQPAVQDLVDIVVPYAAPALTASQGLLSPCLTNPMVEPLVSQMRKIVQDNMEGNMLPSNVNAQSANTNATVIHHSYQHPQLTNVMGVACIVMNSIHQYCVRDTNKQTSPTTNPAVCPFSSTSASLRSTDHVPLVPDEHQEALDFDTLKEPKNEILLEITRTVPAISPSGGYDQSGQTPYATTKPPTTPPAGHTTGRTNTSKKKHDKHRAEG